MTTKRFVLGLLMIWAAISILEFVRLHNHLPQFGPMVLWTFIVIGATEVLGGLFWGFIFWLIIFCIQRIGRFKTTDPKRAILVVTVIVVCLLFLYRVGAKAGQ